MQFRELQREVHRNIRSGTTKALIMALCCLAVLGGSIILEAFAVANILKSQKTFKESGAAIWMIQGENRINPSSCLAMKSVPGFQGAMLVRTTESPHLDALPASTSPAYEVAGDFNQLLRIDSPTAAGGLLMSEQLAGYFDASSGSTISVADKPVTVDGVYEWPTDGRRDFLSGSLAMATPALGEFDECWVEIWPVAPGTEDLLNVVLEPGEGPTQLTQLNARKGPGSATQTLLDERPTAALGYAAPLAGFVLGFIAIRLRRLEIASSQHAGAPRSLLAIQMAAETAVWALTSALVTLAAVQILASTMSPPGESQVTSLQTLPALVAGHTALLLGAILGTLSIQKSALLKYAKDR